MTQMYFTPEEAKKELVRRQNDRELIAHVEAWRNEKKIVLPEFCARGSLAFFARQIATCRYEDIVFQNIAYSADLIPVWIEFTEDKFVASSPYKRSLVQQFHCAGKGRKGGWKLTKSNGIDISKFEGKPMSTICFKDGQSLVDYHHDLQDIFLIDPIRQDLSAYLKSIGSSQDYYYPFLSMFLLHGVLVDDFHSDNYHNGAAKKSDLAFTRDVFDPAWNCIVAELGITPLIVPLPWVDGMQYFPQDGHHDHHVIDCDEIFGAVA